MNSIVMQVLDLVLLTSAAVVIGYELGIKRRSPPPLRIGQRIVRLKPTRKGNYKPVQGFVRAIVGRMVNVRDADDGASTWLDSKKIARR